MASPTTGRFGTAVLDDFTRADEGPPPSSSWTSAIFAEEDGGLKVASNECVPDAATGWHSGYWNAALFSGKSEAWCVVGSDARELFELWLHATPGAEPNGYLVDWDYSGGEDTVRIRRVDEGSYTTLGESIVLELDAGDGLALAHDGEVLTLWHWDADGAEEWVQIATREDATYTEGRVGLRANWEGEEPGIGFGAFGGGEFAAEGPSPTTGKAEVFSGLSHTLKGSVNPNGVSTAVYFEYGETKAYGSRVPVVSQDVGEGKEAVEVEVTRGFAPSTTIHFRLVAEAFGGELFYGEDETFETGDGLDASRIPGTSLPDYADSSPFNRTLAKDGAVAHPDSAAYVAELVSSSPWQALALFAGVAGRPESETETGDYYHPLYRATAEDPQYTVELLEEYPGDNTLEGAEPHIPDEALWAQAGDGHLCIFDEVDGFEYDFWQVKEIVPGEEGKPGKIVASWAGRTPTKGKGIEPGEPTASKGLATGSNFALAAGVIRIAELEAGVIDHALFMVVPDCKQGFVYPASNFGEEAEPTSPYPPFGQRFKLDMSVAEIEALGLAKWEEAILVAFATYGAYVGDQGENSPWFAVESSQPWISAGEEDPLVAFAAKEGIEPNDSGLYRMFFAGGDGEGLGELIDWESKIVAVGSPLRIWAETTAATGITPTKATLNGTIDPYGLPTTYWFERWREDWLAAGEPSRTNLAFNPLLATDLTSHTASATPVTREQTSALPTTDGLPAGITTGVHVVGNSNNDGNSIFNLAVTEGLRYRASVYVYVGSLTATAVRVQAFREGFAASYGTVDFKTVGGGFVRGDIDFVATATEKAVFRVAQTGAGACEFWATGYLVEQADSLGSYFPRPHEIESGQAVKNEDGTYAMATPTYVPVSKDGDAGEGTEAVAVSEAIEGLKPYTPHRVRLVASNADGEVYGGSVAFETRPSSAARVVSEPVDDTLFIEVRHADGNKTRWAADEDDPAGIPQGLKISDSAPGGYRDASFSLTRDPRKTHPDLELVDDVVISGRVAPLGRSAFEGQMAHFPSNLGDDVSIGVNCVGNQVLLDENEFWSALYVALGFEGFGEAPLARREHNAELGRSQGRIPVSTGDDGLVWDPPAEALASGEVSESHYQLPSTLAAAKLGYRGKRKGDWSKFEAATLYGDDTEDFAEGAQSTALTLDETARVAELAGAQRYLMLRAFVSTGHTPAAGVQQSYDRLAVYGDHGIDLQDIDGELPGVYGHDALAHMLDTGAPELNYRVAGDGTIVPNTDFVIPDLAFPDPGKVSEAILKLNGYFLNNFGVWDRREFHWHPWDPDRVTWKARIPGGAHWAPAGRQAITLVNGMVVSFPDVQGRERTAGPPGSGADFESELLFDSDPRNPYTRRGRKRYELLRVDYPLAYGSTAIQIGHVNLLERRIPQRAGTLIVKPLGAGHIPQLEHPTIGPVPIWAPRSGDYIELDGWPEPEPFRVIEKEYDGEAKMLTAQLDTSSPRMSAIMERVGVRSKGVIR